MTIKRFESKVRMSRAVVYNGTAYLCGQVAADSSAGIIDQTQTMLDKVDALLISIGSSRNRILSATIYLKDMTDFADMNSVWDAWITPGEPPARACVKAQMASSELLIEISVVAAVDPSLHD